MFIQAIRTYSLFVVYDRNAISNVLFNVVSANVSSIK